MRCEHIKRDTWSSYGCHRDAEVEYAGKQLCKIHAGAAKRSDKAREKRNQRWQEEDQAYEAAKRTHARINETSALNAQTHYDHRGRAINDRVVVDVAELCRLLGIEVES